MVREIAQATARQSEDIRNVDRAMQQMRERVHQIQRSTREQDRASAEAPHHLEA